MRRDRGTNTRASGQRTRRSAATRTGGQQLACGSSLLCAGLVLRVGRLGASSLVLLVLCLQEWACSRERERERERVCVCVCQCMRVVGWAAGRAGAARMHQSTPTCPEQHVRAMRTTRAQRTPPHPAASCEWAAWTSRTATSPGRTSRRSRAGPPRSHCRTPHPPPPPRSPPLWVGAGVCVCVCVCVCVRARALARSPGSGRALEVPGSCPWGECVRTPRMGRAGRQPHIKTHTHTRSSGSQPLLTLQQVAQGPPELPRVRAGRAAALVDGLLGGGRRLLLACGCGCGGGGVQEGRAGQGRASDAACLVCGQQHAAWRGPWHPGPRRQAGRQVAWAHGRAPAASSCLCCCQNCHESGPEEPPWVFWARCAFSFFSGVSVCVCWGGGGPG
jgi:hypothetical protein